MSVITQKMLLYRVVLINEIGVLSFLDPAYNPAKDQSVPPYLKQVLEESSRFLKKH